MAASLRATVEIPDLRAFIDDSNHRGAWKAEAVIPVLGGTFKSIDNEFALFRRAVGPSGRPVREMVYDATIRSGDKAYVLRGRKYIEPGPLWRVWPATTTLEVRLWDVENPDGEPVAAGILRLSPLGFLRQLTTMDVTNTNWYEKPFVMGCFASFFAGSLVRSYIFGRR
jgi:hypothetical protein